MAFPTVSLLDSFARPEATLSNEGKWEVIPSLVGPGKLISNIIGWVANTTGEGGATWLPNQFSHPAACCSIPTNETSRTEEGHKTWQGIAVCIQREVGTWSGYRIRFVFETIGNARLLIEKVVKGTVTLLAEATKVANLEGEKAFIGISVAGGKVKAWSGASKAAAVVAVEVADSTFTTGYVGPDGVGVGFDGFLNFEAATQPDIPTITKPGTLESDKETPIQPLQVAASESPTKYGATGLPTGLSINTGTGLITGTPVAAVGEYTVTLEAENAIGKATNVTFKWIIVARVTVGAVAEQTGTTGTPITNLTLTRTGGIGAVTWHQEHLPAGLSLNATTGVISGTPAFGESPLVSVWCVDITGAESVKVNFTWTITESYGPNAVNATGRAIWEAMLPIASEDRSLKYPLLRLCDSFGVMWDDLDKIIRDKIVAGKRIPGYSVVMNLPECPETWLPWLSQFTGTQAPPGNATLDRELITGAEGMHRGTVEAVERRVKLLLTGAKRVSVFERFEGKAYKLLVVTFTAETPGSVTTAIIKAAVEEVVPAGMIVTVVTTASWIYNEVPPAETTYQKTHEDYKTYKGLASHQLGK